MCSLVSITIPIDSLYMYVWPWKITKNYKTLQIKTSLSITPSTKFKKFKKKTKLDISPLIARDTAGSLCKTESIQTFCVQIVHRLWYGIHYGSHKNYLSRSLNSKQFFESPHKKIVQSDTYKYSIQKSNFSFT